MMNSLKSKNRLWMLAALAAGSALAAGCASAEVEITPALELPPTLQATSARVSPGPVTPESIFSTPSLEPTRSVPDASPEVPPASAHPLSGLVLSSPNQTYYVDQAGQVAPLVDQPRARLSPDGSYVLFSRPDPVTGMNDLYLIERASGQETNLTQTTDRDEASPQWWPAHPETAFFGSGQGSGMENPENPSSVNLDGTSYTVLDEGGGGPAALSPDGSSIAYAGFDGAGRIYHMAGEIQVLDPAAYGLPEMRLAQPSFSPDGKSLAWLATGDLNGDGSQNSGVAVFDLQEKTGRLLHVYSPQGGGMFPQTIAWSPDGTRLATVTFGEPPAEGRLPNLWVLQADGSSETYVDAGLEPTWSPDGGRLAYLQPGPDGMPVLRIVESGTWAPVPFEASGFPEPPQFIQGWSLPGGS